MTGLAETEALVTELCYRKVRRGHHRSQQRRAFCNGLFCDGESRRPAPAHEIRVCAQGAQHHVDIGDELEVADEVQAASTSFTRRTALEASSA